MNTLIGGWEKMHHRDTVTEDGKESTAGKHHMETWGEVPGSYKRSEGQGRRSQDREGM